MPRTKGSKNRAKSDIASQIAEKQSVIQTLTAEVETIQKDIAEKKANLKTKKSELKSTEKEVAKLEAKKAKADQKAAEEAVGKRYECGRDPRKTEIRSAVWTN